MGRALALLLAVLILGAAVAAAPSPVGVYATVSESEWEMELTLASSNMARLDLATWEPGEVAHPKVETIIGEWRPTEEGVAISFKEGTLRLRFDPKLGFAAFGREGAAPGMVVTSTNISKWQYAGVSFWLKRELDKLK